MNVAKKRKIGSTDLLVGFKELRWWKSLGFERMWQCSDYRLHVTNVSWFLAITHPLSFSHHCVFFSLARLSLDFLSLICWKKKPMVRLQSLRHVPVTLFFCPAMIFSCSRFALPLLSNVLKKKNSAPQTLCLFQFFRFLSFSSPLHFSTHNPQIWREWRSTAADKVLNERRIYNHVERDESIPCVWAF